MGLVTGCFSLVGIQEVISYEYIYKLTQYNVVPDTPVSSNAEGSVPEGWSSQLLGVSASLPYLWESRRQKKDSYVTRDLSSSSFTRNYWIGTNGVASYSNGYSYSEVFDLPSGQTIEVLTAGTGFSVISKYSNRSYTPIVKASGSVSEQKMYTYTADTDCQIVVSVYHLSSYSVKITSGTWSAWSTPTLKSSWGKQGAKMRMRTWSSNTEYLSGADGEEFYDVVIYLEKLYLCTKTHTSKSGTNDPVTSINGYLGFWESAQEWTFIATKLLLAEKINAEQINADGIKAKNVDIEGKITATSGILGGFTVTQSAIGSTDVGDSLLLMRNGISFNNNKKTAGIGDTLPGSTGIVSKVAGIFTTTLDKYDLHSEGIGTLIVQSKGGVSHTALSIVTEGRDYDTAIEFRGKINTHGSELGGPYGDYGLTTAVGFQHVWDPSAGRFRLGDLCFVNGILTGVRWHDN